MSYILVVSFYTAMIGKSNAILLALLLAIPTVFLAAAVLTPVYSQPTYSAWIKIVTDSWDGGAFAGFTTPVNPTGVGFADRYNVTNACVELYRFKNPNRESPAPLNAWDGPIAAGSPNGTGFIRISWPSGWENVTIIVKAKSYQGDCIGAGNPFTGIIIYWLTVNPTASFLSKFGFTATNSTIGDDGIEVPHGGDFDWNIPAPYGSGPVDVVEYASGPITFTINHNDPRNAWVARAAYIFKLFHAHTWYATDDVLTYAIIFIHDTDHTPATSTQSLLQAAITGNDGQSRYTREIYPSAVGIGSGRFANNRLVPIPLQTVNLAARTPFIGGIPDPEDPDGNIQAPHLNATVRVWWETVLVNQTLYVGNEYNGTLGPFDPEYDIDPATGKTRPLFGAFAEDPTVSPTVTQGGIRGVPAGPFSLALNHTVDLGINGFQVPGLEWDTAPTLVENIADFISNTVFYGRFCVQDADMNIQHPEVGDKMVGAEVTINLKTRPNTPYYLTHNILTTDSGGCTSTPHKWPGYLNQYSRYARFPNGTNWGLRGSLNASLHFNPVDDASPAWRPGGYFESAWGGDWRGPYINAGRNWSALIPEITYMKTRTLADDKSYEGFDIQVKWKGGSRNGYGGTPVLVDNIRVRNPYAIAVTDFEGWVEPFLENGEPAWNFVLVKVHRVEGGTFTVGDKVLEPPLTLMLNSSAAITIALTGYDPVTGLWSSIAVDGTVDVWIVENATLAAADIAYTLLEPFLENAEVSIKFHDASVDGNIMTAGFASSAWLDIGADGLIDNTGITSMTAGADEIRGEAEVEIWPGPPGSGTIRALLSIENIDVDITSASFSNFVGAMLVGGTPTEIELTANAWPVIILQPLAPNEAPDIALFRTGLVYITAKVHDIAFRLLDNMGNPLPAANTAVTLIRTNGPNVVKSGGGFDPDRLVGGLAWSYQMHGEGWAVFYQLPGELAYDVVVTFDGTPVYDEPGFEIPKLVRTEFIDLVTNVFKVKLVFVDCADQLIPGMVGPSTASWVRYRDQNGNLRISPIDAHGALDFGYTAGGTITIDGIW